MAIDQNDPRPLSTQIAEDLRRRIAAEEFKVGEKFPSLRSLASQYAVAELTVHGAVKDLQHEGVLISTAGRGTFVRAVPEDNTGTGVVDLAALRDEVAGLRERVEAIERAQRDR